jgi:hypothetical protein
MHSKEEPYLCMGVGGHDSDETTRKNLALCLLSVSHPHNPSPPPPFKRPSTDYSQSIVIILVTFWDDYYPHRPLPFSTAARFEKGETNTHGYKTGVTNIQGYETGVTNIQGFETGDTNIQGYETRETNIQG